MAPPKKSATRAPKSAPKKAPKEEPVEEPVVEAPVAETQEPTLRDNMNESLKHFSLSIQTMSESLVKLRAEYRELVRAINRDARVADRQIAKSKSRRKKGSGNGGFVTPTPISDEFAAFLGLDKGTQISRSEGSKLINKYIKDHKLQDEDNGRIIHPDAKLKGLLKITDDSQELTYFNYQRYIKDHYLKAKSA